MLSTTTPRATGSAARDRFRASGRGAPVALDQPRQHLQEGDALLPVERGERLRVEGDAKPACLAGPPLAGRAERKLDRPLVPRRALAPDGPGLLHARQDF